MKELNNYILYCSNLDDNEYNLLWEYYNEQSFLNKIKEDFSYLFFTLFIWKISTKDYLTKNLKRFSKIWKQTIGQTTISLSVSKTLLARCAEFRPRIWILEICIPTAYRLVMFKRGNQGSLLGRFGIVTGNWQPRRL